MGKNKDVVQILLLILIGMFIPFLGSITFTYGFEWRKIGVTFGYFIIIFALELFAVYLYFTLGTKNANKKIQKYKPKKEDNSENKEAER